MRRLVIAFIVLALLVAGGIYGAGWYLSHPVPATIGAAPASLHAHDVTFRSGSGSLIHGWLCTVASPRGYALLLPGIRANRLSMIDRAQFLMREGYSCLLIDFQATGESAGEHITFGRLESRDAAAAVQYLRAFHKPIIVVATSLGGAAALLADLQIDGAVLEEVYPTIEAATDNRLRVRFGFLAPIGTWILVHQLRTQMHIDPNQLRPVDHIARLHCPVLIIGGGADRYTTPADTRLMYARANERKALWLVPGMGHNDAYRFAPEEYEKRVGAFLRADSVAVVSR